MSLKNFDTYIFDLDGTLWDFPKVFSGVDKVFKKLEEMNKNILIVSNFTFLDRDGALKILRDNNIEVEKEKFITSSYVASLLLKGKKTFVIGDGLKKELRKNGVTVVNKNVEAVVVGHDTKFNYWKGKEALEHLIRGAEFYTTAIGKIWNFKNQRVPGTGLILAGLEYCSGRKAIMVGKPSEYICEISKKLIIGRAVHFGDELQADSEFSKKVGAKFVFVRSGVDKDSKEVKAYKVLNSVKDLLKFL